MAYLIGHDVGTSATKTVLTDERGRVIASHVARYALSRHGERFAEQDERALYEACAQGARVVVATAGITPEGVRAMAFAGQMLSLVSLTADGTPARPLISWMDARADAEARAFIRRFGGERILRALAGGTPTAKDLVCKIAWIRDREPEIFARVAAFTDATGYLVARTTGTLAIDPTAAGATGLLDVRTRTWMRALARLGAFPLEKMPRLVPCTEVVGTLLPEAARDFGLHTTTRVVMGLADIPAAAIGSGAVRDGDAHVYVGTSAWVGVTTRAPVSVASVGIASVPSADPSLALAIGESETAGACRDWLERLLGEGCDLEALARISHEGARGLLFVPWMYGERTPFPSPHVRGAFLHLSLDHERADLVRALYEGIAYNLRWTLDAFTEADRPCTALRAIGGGTLSDVAMQTLADVTQRPISRVREPRLAGAVGAALVAGVGVGLLGSVAEARALVGVERTFEPRVSARALHDSRYRTFRDFAPSLARLSKHGG